MPSKDTFKGRRDEHLTGSEKPRETTPVARPKGRSVSSVLLRLARRMDADPDAMAERIPEDTLRRLKYPLLETINEDGTRSFKHDPLIAEARKAEVRP